MNLSYKTTLPVSLAILGILASLLFVSALPAQADDHEGAALRFQANVTAVPKDFDLSGSQVIVINNGNAAVGHAKVTAVASSTITAQTSIGNTILTWSVATDANTVFLPKAGPKFASSTGSIADVHAGDTISFAGAIDTGASGILIHAKVVRDPSFVLSHTVATTTPEVMKNKGFGAFLNALKTRFNFHFFFR